ncbi:unnamed protein product [Orchesella dallaii]|uniref:Uncharacterized protein n=1 Tax=Orchesella dallaii TaxID=48710 RepID=A0ABP1PN27_9HEXA
MGGSTILLVISLFSELVLQFRPGEFVRLVLQSTSPSIEQSSEAANRTTSPLIEKTKQSPMEKSTMQINNLTGVNINNPEYISQPNSTSELELLIPGIGLDNSDKKKLAKRSLNDGLPKRDVDLQFARVREYYIHHDPKYLEELPNPPHSHTWGGHNWHGRADTITELGKMGHRPTKMPFYVKDVSYKYNEYYYWWWALLPGGAKY